MSRASTFDKSASANLSKLHEDGYLQPDMTCAENRSIHDEKLSKIVNRLSSDVRIDLIWVEGSIAEGHSWPCSDYDLRIAIRDEHFDDVWNSERDRLVDALGGGLVLEQHFLRLLRDDMLVIEMMAVRTSALPAMKLPIHHILFASKDFEDFRFKVREPRLYRELWPTPLTIDIKFVETQFKRYLLRMLFCPNVLYSQESLAARWLLETTRSGLVELMYAIMGVRYCKRYKHLSEILPPEFLRDLQATYDSDSEASLDAQKIAAAFVVVFQKIGCYLEQLSLIAGGGFDSKWFWAGFEHTTSHLKRLETRNTPPPSKVSSAYVDRWK